VAEKKIQGMDYDSSKKEEEEYLPGGDGNQT
jgi:hypothetical protein